MTVPFSGPGTPYSRSSSRSGFAFLDFVATQVLREAQTFCLGWTSTGARPRALFRLICL